MTHQKDPWLERYRRKIAIDLARSSRDRSELQKGLVARRVAAARPACAKRVGCRGDRHDACGEVPRRPEHRRELAHVDPEHARVHGGLRTGRGPLRRLKILIHLTDG